MRLSSSPFLPVCCLVSSQIRWCLYVTPTPEVRRWGRGRTRPRPPPLIPDGDRRRDPWAAGRRHHQGWENAIPLGAISFSDLVAGPRLRPGVAHSGGHTVRGTEIHTSDLGPPNRVEGAGQVGVYAACKAFRVLKNTAWSKTHTHAGQARHLCELCSSRAQLRHQHQMETVTGTRLGTE